MNNMKSLVETFIQDPSNDESNFQLALAYDSMGHIAPATSFYLRTAERTNDNLLAYESLIRASMCFDSQKTRKFTVKGLLQHAVSLMPKRPEAYYLLSKLHEREKTDDAWRECYTIASIGQEVSVLSPPPLRTDVGYPSQYGLLFQKAVSSWWCGLFQESMELFKNLYCRYELDETHRQSVISNIKLMGSMMWGMKADDIIPFPLYNKSKFNRIRQKFAGSDLIEKNYSEAYQDMFVLTMLNGKRNGTYLEIGAGSSFYGSNTALLEQTFNWKGIGIDIDEQFLRIHKRDRKNTVLVFDATKIDYKDLLSSNGFLQDVDYLQIDCEPPNITYEILKMIPFDSYRFAVITYEHDYYCDETKSYQEKARVFLESKGYIRVVNNISPDDVKNYEDWWVHPDLVDSKIIVKMLKVNDDVKKAEDYMLNG